MPTLTALFAPTVNSYKRLVPGSWASTAVSWGVDNRTAALRLIGDMPASFRLEHRVPGADANPYLALAAMVAAGLYGIEHRLPLHTPPVQGNAYDVPTLPPLPRTLAEATAALREGAAFAKTLFGEAFVEHFIATREWECRQVESGDRMAVSDAERMRYLELV